MYPLYLPDLADDRRRELRRVARAVCVAEPGPTVVRLATLLRHLADRLDRTAPRGPRPDAARPADCVGALPLHP